MLKKIIFNRNYFNLTQNIKYISNAAIIFNKEINDSNSENSSALIKTFLSDGAAARPMQLPDIINGLSKIQKHDIEPAQLSKIFNKIFELYKNDFEQSGSIIKTEEFRKCCVILKHHAPRMMSNELLICLKTLVSLNLNSHNRLVQQLLHHLKEDINELSLSQLAFLNYLLSKLEATALVNALRIAIPIVFDLNIGLKMDHENPDELLKLLHYVSLTEMKISDKSMTNLISALTLHGTSLSVYNAQTILTAIRKLPFKYFENYEVLQKLVQNCIHIMNTNFEDSTFPRMEAMLEKMIRTYKYSGMDVFYNETFFNTCVKHLIANDLGFVTAYHILRRFNEINFVNYDLLNYIDQQIIQNHTHLSTMYMNQVMNLISAFSSADYKSENWEIIKSILHENPVLHNDLKMDMPHLKFICELLSLDFVSKIYFDKVLSEDFLVQYLKKNSSKNFANLPQLRLIDQVLRLLYPKYDGILPNRVLLDVANEAIPSETTCMNDNLKETLENIFGTGTIQMNVLTKQGHLLDFVISFDYQNKALTLPCKVQYYEDIPKSQVRSVAVFFHSRKSSPVNLPMKLRGIIGLRRRTLEAIGIVEVDIALHCLELLPESEKLNYIEREIRCSLE